MKVLCGGSSLLARALVGVEVVGQGGGVLAGHGARPGSRPGGHLCDILWGHEEGHDAARSREQATTLRAMKTRRRGCGCVGIGRYIRVQQERVSWSVRVRLSHWHAWHGPRTNGCGARTAATTRDGLHRLPSLVV